MLEKIFEALELDTKERLVYKLILERGKIAPSLIARLGKLNRTTVYSVAKGLKTKGLIIEDLGGKTLYYMPARSTELEKIISEEEKRSNTKKNTLRELQKVLNELPDSKTHSVPKIRFIDEVDMEQYAYESNARWFESARKTDLVCRGFQDHTLIERVPEWVDWGWDNAPEGFTVELLTNDSQIEKVLKTKKYAARRKIRFWNKGELTASQLIVGDYIILVMTRKKPYYMVEIHDAVIAQNMREVFKELWSLVKN